MHNAKEAVAYMRELHRLVRYLGICDGNMQEGSFRCDANVSVRRQGSDTLGTRTETKNLNSFRFVERAIDYEIERQIDILEDGGEIVQETRLYDADKDETRSMRSKEDAHDYRYFPDPDLLPVGIPESLLERMRNELPELPGAKHARYVDTLGLSPDDATAIVNDPAIAEFFEAALAAGNNEARTIANWVTGELFAAMRKDEVSISQLPITALALNELVSRVADNTISGKIAKEVFQDMWAGAGSPDEIIESKGLKQISDTGAIEAIVREVLDEHPEQVQQLRDGKEKILGFLVGQVMKRTQGKADPSLANELIRLNIDSE